MFTNTLYKGDSAEKVVQSKKSNKRVAKGKFPTAKSERAENDYYATDPMAAKYLLNVETFNKNVWECASGENHLADTFKKYGYNVRTSDIVKRTPSTEVLDFLSKDVKHWDGDIITNPPYRHCQEFVEKALSIIPVGHKVAMFLRLQFLEGLGRYEFFRENPPKVVYVSSKRIKCGKDGEFNSASSSITAYAWFVWEKGYKGSPSIEWINHNEVIKAPKKHVAKQTEIPEEDAHIAPIYAHHELSDKDILTKRHKVGVWVKGRKQTLYVQRVSSCIYERFGFSKYHYIEKPINKGAMCFLFSDERNRPIAFVGLLNHTFKGCSNGIMVSRFVILPKFQKRGLSLPILKAIGGMLSANGYQMYINTQDKQLGEALGRRKCFVGTTFDQVDRSGEYDKTQRNRIWGKAWRKKYCGGRLYGYSELFKKVGILRKKVSNNSISNDNIHSKILYPIDSFSKNRYNSPNLAIYSPIVGISSDRWMVGKESVCNAPMASCCALMEIVGVSCFNTS